MSISKSMTGASWHIEKVNGSNKNRRSCFNCKYHNEGGWCSRQKIQCTNNNAPICKAYNNKYNNQKNKSKNNKNLNNKKTKVTNKRVQNKLYIPQNPYRDMKVNLFIQPTDEKLDDILNVDKKIDIMIKTNLSKEANYDFDLQSVFLKTKSGKYYEIAFKPLNNGIIKSNEYISISFSYKRVRIVKSMPKKTSRICYGNDSIYGSIELRLA